MQRVEQPNALLSGHFVTFSLNPLPFLERFGDAEAVGEAKNLSHKRYLGCVSTRNGQVLFNELFDRAGICVLSTKPPISTPFPWILDQISFIPVAPSSHPRGRRTVVPSSPLPWKELFFHSNAELKFLINTINTHNSSGIFLSEEDVDYVMDAIMEDKHRLGDVETEDSDNDSHEALELEDSDSDPTEGWEFVSKAYEDNLSTHGATVNFETVLPVSDRTPRSFVSEEEFILYLRLFHLRSLPPPPIDIWRDLSDNPDIGNHLELLQECWEIRNIFEGVRTRIEERMNDIARESLDREGDVSIGERPERADRLPRVGFIKKIRAIPNSVSNWFGNRGVPKISGRKMYFKRNAASVRPSPVAKAAKNFIGVLVSPFSGRKGN